MLYLYQPLQIKWQIPKWLFLLQHLEFQCNSVHCNISSTCCTSVHRLCKISDACCTYMYKLMLNTNLATDLMKSRETRHLYLGTSIWSSPATWASKWTDTREVIYQRKDGAHNCLLNTKMDSLFTINI